MNFLAFALFFIFGSIGFAQEYNFATDQFQLGRWNRKSITFERGLAKIGYLDRWYDSLAESDRRRYKGDYVVNRNRLFLVTQEKQFELKKVESPSLTAVLADRFQPSWIAAERTIIKEDAAARLQGIQKFNDEVLGSDAALNTDWPVSLITLNKIGVKEQSNFDFVSDLNRSYSKQGMGGGGQGLPISTGSSSLDSKLASSIRGIFRGAESFSEWSDSRCTKRPSEEENLAPKKAKDFAEKKKAFLDKLGLKESKPKKISNDLSSWYSKPDIQWLVVGSTANYKCVGYAVSSDVAAVANKSSFFNKDLSPQQAFAQVHVITREVLEERSKISPMSQEEQEILQALQDVPSLKTSHAEFCNPAFYNINPKLGTAKLDHSLAYVFKGFKNKAICGRREVMSRGKNIPLYTVEDFAAMEFEDAKDHALTYDFFRNLIDSGNPPIVLLDSDQRSQEITGWLKITKPSPIQHPVNIVGYGEEINPITLCKEQYFKIRNSLGKKEMHYKIPASNLLKHIIGVYKVTSIQEAKK